MVNLVCTVWSFLHDRSKAGLNWSSERAINALNLEIWLRAVWVNMFDIASRAAPPVQSPRETIWPQRNHITMLISRGSGRKCLDFVRLRNELVPTVCSLPFRPGKKTGILEGHPLSIVSVE